jgi:uncharacterized protein
VIKLVVDTNALLVSIPQFSAYHWFFQSIVKKEMLLFITTEILSEYEEVIASKLTPQIASSVIRTLIELENVIPTTVYFKYQLIRQDPDDDKFVNCAIAANTDFIVTHDRHFGALKTIDFPKIKTITLPELSKILTKS